MAIPRLLVIASVAGAAGALGVGAGLCVQRSQPARVPVANDQVAAALGKLDQRLAALQLVNDSMRLQLAAQGQAPPAVAAPPSPLTLVANPDLGAAVGPPSETPPADPAVAFEALELGHALLNRAIATGRWSTEDRNTLRGVLANTDSSGTSELLTTLVAAINADKLTPAL